MDGDSAPQVRDAGPHSPRASRRARQDRARVLQRDGSRASSRAHGSPLMANDTRTPQTPRGRSLAQRVAAKALGLDPTEMDNGESRGGLRNPFARDKRDNEEDNDEGFVPNCHIGVGSN